MNVMTQCCGIVILLTLFIFYVVQKKLFLRTEKTFLFMLFFSFLTHALDILSLCAIDNMSLLTPTTLELCCKLYPASLIVVVMCVHWYICEDIFRDVKQFVKHVLCYTIVGAAGLICVFALPIHIYSQENTIYTYGPSAYATYITVFIGIAAILYYANMYRKNINPDRRTAIHIWMSLWTVAALIQLVFPNLLLVSFAVSIGVMILYIKLEDPCMNINKQSGLFSQNALIEYIKQKYVSGKSFAIVIFQLDSTVDIMQGTTFAWERALDMFSGKNAIAFRKSADEAALIFQSREEAIEWENSLSERLEKDNDPNALCLKKALWISIYDSSAFFGIDELFYFLRRIVASQRFDADIMASNHIVADEKLLKEFYAERDAEKLIDDALEYDRIEVFYQPIFSNRAGKFTAAEALVRIRDESGKIIPPGMFIPVAEKTGKILPLGNAVFEKVCRFINERKPDELGVDYIEVNLSMVQCSDENLADIIISTMEKYNISPKYINLEITESATLKRKDIFMTNLDRLREYGISFSLDDFGTGHSNLNYIVDMPVDIVKFDRDMTNAFFVDKKAYYVMEAAMQMIHGMGLDIVSEGIETAEQYMKISSMGIAYIQGYFFSKPIPQDEFYAFVSVKNGVNV